MTRPPVPAPGGKQLRVQLKVLWLSLALVLLPVYAWGTPVIRSVRSDSESIGRYEKLELAVDLSANYTSYLDESDIRLYALFNAPGGDTATIEGFWDPATAQWKIRFSPWQMGTWMYTVYLTDDGGQEVVSAGPFSFLCTPSSHHGPIRISSNDRHYLMHDDGTSFFGVGVDKFRNVESTYWSRPANLHANGINLLSVQLWTDNGSQAYGDYAVFSASGGLDRVRTRGMFNMERLISEAEEHEIYILLGLNHNGSFWQEPWSWPQTAFAQRFSVRDFIVDDGSSPNDAWIYQQRHLRYILSRWGYSRAIAGWEIINEVEIFYVWNSYATEAEVRRWVERMERWLREHDPYHHPITLSNSAHREGWISNEGALLDNHIYSPKTPVELARGIADRIQSWRWGYAQPTIIGEFGLGNDGELTAAHQPDTIHYAIWAGLSTGAAATPLQFTWTPAGAWQDVTREMVEQLHHLANFVRDISFDKLGLQNSRITVPAGLEAWGLNSPSFGLAWLMSSNPSQRVTGGSLRITGLQAGNFCLLWYDPWSGGYFRAEIVPSSLGKLTISIPSFVKDIALKYKAIGEGEGCDIPDLSVLSHAGFGLSAGSGSGVLSTRFQTPRKGY